MIVDALGGMYYGPANTSTAKRAPMPLIDSDVADLASNCYPTRAPAIVDLLLRTPPSARTVKPFTESLLVAAGYTNVRKYHEGIQDWVEAGLPVESGAPSFRS